MIKVGLIGCGEHSENGHAVPLARYKAAHPGEIELAAACDLNLARANAFCTRYGFGRAYSNAEAMLAQEKVDVCIAVVPVEKISALGIQLMGMGIPCVVEKPLGASLSEVQALLAASKSSGTPNMVSVNRRFMPFLNRAIEWSRRAGPLRYVRGTMTRHARTEPEFLWTTAVHAVDALRHIAGEVAEASIRAMPQNVRPQPGLPSTCVLKMAAWGASMFFRLQACWKRPTNFSARAIAQPSHVLSAHTVDGKPSKKIA